MSKYISLERERAEARANGDYHVLKPGMIRKVNFHFMTGSYTWLHKDSYDDDPHLFTDPGCTCTSPIAPDWHERCSKCRFNVRQVGWDELAEVIEIRSGRSYDAKVKLLKDGMIGWLYVQTLKPLDFPNKSEDDWK